MITQFALPAGQGSVQLIVRILNTMVTSNSITYGYARGSIVSVSPSSGSTAGNVLLTITGSNLGSDLTNALFVAGGCSTRNRVVVGSLECIVVEVGVCMVCGGGGRDWGEGKGEGEGPQSSVSARCRDLSQSWVSWDDCCHLIMRSRIACIWHSGRASLSSARCLLAMELPWR